MRDHAIPLASVERAGNTCENLSSSTRFVRRLTRHFVYGIEQQLMPRKGVAQANQVKIVSDFPYSQSQLNRGVAMVRLRFSNRVPRGTALDAFEESAESLAVESATLELVLGAHCSRALCSSQSRCIWQYICIYTMS